MTVTGRILRRHNAAVSAEARSSTPPTARWALHALTDERQAERMNRTIKDATVKVYHYDGLEGLKALVLAFVTAYNFAKHLTALR